MKKDYNIVHRIKICGYENRLGGFVGFRNERGKKETKTVVYAS